MASANAPNTGEAAQGRANESNGSKPFAVILGGPPASGRTKLGEKISEITRNEVAHLQPHEVHDDKIRELILTGKLPLCDPDYRPKYLDDLEHTLRILQLLHGKNGRPYIVGVSLFTAEERKRILEFVKGEAPMVFLQVTRKELRSRVRERCKHEPDHWFTPEMLEACLDCWEDPKADEGVHLFDASGTNSALTKSRRLLEEHVPDIYYEFVYK